LDPIDKNNRQVIYNIATKENTPTEIFFETFDIDWFMYDIVGQVVQFASTGSGYVPPEVKKHYSDMKVFAEYVYKLPIVSDVEHYKEHFPKQFRSEKSKSMYLDSVSKFPQKGLYSYTSENVNGYERDYKILSSPSKPITIDQFPDKVRSLSCMFKLDFKLSELPKIISSEDIKKCI